MLENKETLYEHQKILTGIHSGGRWETDTWNDGTKFRPLEFSLKVFTEFSNKK